IAADDVTTSTLTLTAKDRFGNNIQGLASALSVIVTDSGGHVPVTGTVTVGSLTETPTPGVYAATLKGNLAGTWTVKPQVNGSAIGSLSDSVTLTSGSTPDGSQSAFAASPKSIVADDVATSLLTFTAKDSFGNAITGIAGNISFTVSGSGGSAPAAGKITVSSVTETATAGIYTATLKGQLADTWTVKPQVNGSAIGSLSDSVTLTSGSTPDGTQSSFAASPKSIVADDVATSLLTFTAKDAFGNAIAGITADKLSFSVTGSGGSAPEVGKVTVSGVTETATTGVYTATLKGQLADTYIIKPQFSSSNVGNLSDSVTLTSGSTPDGTQSTFIASPKSIAADDVATSTLTLTAKDKFGNTLVGLAGSLNFAVTGSGGSAPVAGKVTVSSITETATPGIYTATLKGQQADIWTVKPQMNGSAIGSLNDTVELTAGTTPDAAHSLFAASPSSVTADDLETSTLKLVAKDSFGNLIPGIAGSVSFLVTPAADGKITVSNVSETTRGNYTATLRGTRAGTYTVVPQISGTTLGSLTDTVVLKSGTVPDAGQSVFEVSPASIVADGIQSSNLLLTVKDVNGNNISGIVSRLSLKVTDSQSGSAFGAGITVSGLTETAAPGIYRATLKGTQTGSLNVVPQADDVAMGNLSGIVTLTAGAPDGSQSTFAASPKSIVADDNATSLLTFTAKDAFGNTIAGITADKLNVTVTDSGGSAPAAGKVTVSSLSETATPGTYTATLKGTQAGLWTLTPKFNGSAMGGLRDTVTLTAGTTPDGSQSVFVTSPKTIVADDVETSTLTLTAKDVNGNTISGIAGSLNFRVTDSGGSAPAAGKVTLNSVTETATPGVYTATLKGTLAGTYTVKPQVNGSVLGSLSDIVVLTASTTPDAGQSTFVASPVSLVADGTQSSNLLLTVKDANGNNITGLAGSLSLAVTDNQSGLPAGAAITVSSLTETAAPGIYRATLKGTLAGTWKVVPKYAGTAMGLLSGIVSLTAGAADAGQSAFAASPKSIVADDTATSTLTLTVKDVNGNTISGIAGSLNFLVTDSGGSTPAGGKVTVSNITETATPGTYTATLKGQLAGIWTVKPQVNGSVLGSLSDTVTLTAGSTPDNARSSFTATPDSVVADDTATSTLILSVRDAFGNAIGGIVDNLSVTVTDSGGSAPAAGKVTVSSLSETATPGTYTATLKGTQAGLWTVTPKFNGSVMGGLSDTVTLTAGTTPDGSQSVFVTGPKTIVADDVETSTLTLTAKDVNGNTISGIAGSLSFRVTDSGGSAPAAGKVTLNSVTETATPGVYTATLKGTLAGTYTVKPQVNGSVLGSLSDTVTLTAGSTPDEARSSFTATPDSVAADDTATSTLILSVRDAFGNAIGGIVGNLSVTVTDSGGSAPAAGKVTLSSLSETATPGTYTATLKGTQAGLWTLTPKFNGSAMGALNDTVMLTAGAVDGSQSVFAAGPKTIVADDMALSTLTLTAKDVNGNAISGIAGSLSIKVTGSGGETPTAAQVTVGTVTETTTPGIYSTTLKGTHAGTYTVQPQVSGAVIGTLSDAVTLTADPTPNTEGTSTFVASPKSVVADNAETSTLTLTALDKFSNAIGGIADKLSLVITDSHGGTPPAGTVTLGNMVETSTAGTYTATLKGTLADTYTIKPQFEGRALGTLADTATLTANLTPDASKMTLAASPDSIVADNVTTSTLTLTAKDRYGNAIPGIANNLTLDVKDSHGLIPAAGTVTVTGMTEMAGTPGSYTATLKGTLADTYTVKPMHSGTVLDGLSASVTLTAGTTPDAGRSSFATSPKSIVADDTVTSTLTFTAKDGFGNAISGIATSLSFSVKGTGDYAPAPGEVTVSGVTETGSTGVYTATLTGKRADTYTLKPQFSSSAVGSLSDTVTLTAGAPDASRMTLAASPDSIVADNVTTSTLTLTAKDLYGNAIPGIAGSLTLDVKDSHGADPAAGKVTVTGMTESLTTPGSYTATLKGMLADTYTVKPLHNSSALDGLSASVTLTAGTTPDAGQSVFATSPKSIVADDTVTSTLTFTAKDGFGNTIINLSGLSFSVKGSNNYDPAPGEVTMSDVTETGSTGVYTATLKGTRADTYTVKPQLNNIALGELSDTVTLTANLTPDASKMTLAASPDSIVADNVTISTLTLTAKDRYGNAIPGIAGSLTLNIKDSHGLTPAAGTVTVTDVTESLTTPGSYTATLKGTLADTYTVKPMHSGTVLDGLSASVTLTAGTTPDAGQSAFATSPKSIVADDTTTSTLTFTAKDGFGNAISGIASSLSFGVKGSGNYDPATGEVTVSSVTETGSTGVYTATLKGTRADTYTVKPQHTTATLGSLSDTVTLTAGAPDASKSTLLASKAHISSDNGDQSVLTMTLADKFGNAVSGQVANLKLVMTDSQALTPPADKVILSGLTEVAGTPGTYSATLNGNLVGLYTVKAQFKDGAAFTDIGTLEVEVTVDAGAIDAAHSGFVATPDTINANNTEQSTLTLTLKDAHDNLVKGVASNLLFFQVKTSTGGTPDSSKYTSSTMQELSPGNYTITLKGFLVDTLTVRPMYNGSLIGEGATELKATVTLKAGEFKDITANGKTFTVNSGFPSIGFSDNGSVPGPIGKPTFTLNMPVGKTATDYTWQPDQNWLTVSNVGVITFGASMPDSSTNTVTITATPKTGGQTLAYKFTINTWYKVRANDGVTWAQGNTYCSSLGMTTPSSTQLTSGQNVRVIGSLWGEWGNLINASTIQTGLVPWYKTSSGPSGNHTIVLASDGQSISYTDNENAGVGTACLKSL
ncbi:hypothetical protein ABNZ70_004833, partial [Salmonella enterica]